MENKKLIIAIVIVLILILGIVGITYLFSSFGKKQMKLLTEESNKILQSDISKDNIDFDIKTGRICALVIPGPCKLFGVLGREHEYIIPYCNVQRIGADVILVEADIEKCLHKCEWN